MKTSLTRASVIAALVGAAFAAPASAQQIKLKFSQVFPNNHWHWTESVRVFEEEVSKATNGRVQFENYHAGQLSKEGVTAITSGIADFAILVPSYEAAKLPLTSVSELPGLHSSSCEGTAKLWNIVKEGGPLNDAEYKPKGIKVLYAILLAPYSVMTANKQVREPRDMSGLKLRANGAAMDKTIRAFGAVPIRVTTTELYDALTRGTVDGGFWPLGSTRNSNLEDLFHYTVRGPMLGAGSSLYGMKQSKWDRLPKDVQDAMTKAAAKAQEHLCTYLDRSEDAEVDWLTKNKDFKATTLSGQEIDRWTERVKPIAEEWAKEIDSTGRPGSKLLKAFREASDRPTQ